MATNTKNVNQYISSYSIPQPTLSTLINQQQPHHVYATTTKYNSINQQNQQLSHLQSSRTAGFINNQSGSLNHVHSYPTRVQRIITQQPTSILSNSRAHVISRGVTQTQLTKSQQQRSLTPQLQRLLNKPVYLPTQNGGTMVQNYHAGNQFVQARYGQTGYVQSKYNKTFNQYKVPYPTKHQISQQNSRAKIQRQQRIIHLDTNEQNLQQPPKRITARVQYVPYMRKYYEWQPRQVVNVVYVPVQRVIEDFYQVEHYIDYQPVAREQTIIEYIPEERVNYKVEYQMVQKKIVHMPQNGQITDLKNFREQDRLAYMNEKGYNSINGYGYVYTQEPVRIQTHYVTSEVPSYKIQIQPQFFIEQRENKFKDVREENIQVNDKPQVNRNSNRVTTQTFIVKESENVVMSNNNQSKVSNKDNKYNPFNNLAGNQENNEPQFVLQ